MPPSAMLGRSWLYVHSQRVALSCTCSMVSNKVVAQPGVADGAVVAFDVGILLRLARLDVLDPDAFTFGPGQ